MFMCQALSTPPQSAKFVPQIGMRGCQRCTRPAKDSQARFFTYTVHPFLRHERREDILSWLDL